MLRASANRQRMVASLRFRMAAISEVEKFSMSRKIRTVRYFSGTWFQNQLDFLPSVELATRVGHLRVGASRIPIIGKNRPFPPPATPAQMVESQIHANPKQPRSEPTGRVELIETNVGSQESLLRKVFRQFKIRHKSENEPGLTAVRNVGPKPKASRFPRRASSTSRASLSGSLLLRTPGVKFGVRHAIPVGPALFGSHL